MTATFESRIGVRDMSGRWTRSEGSPSVDECDRFGVETGELGQAARPPWQTAEFERDRGLRCAWCHDDLCVSHGEPVLAPELEAVACEVCGVWLHRACREESRADGGPTCPTLGCPGRRLFASPSVKGRPRDRRGSGPRRLIRQVSGPGPLFRYVFALPLAIVLGVLVMAGAVLCGVFTLPILLILFMACGLSAEAAMFTVGGGAALGILALGFSAARLAWRELTKTEVKLRFER